jgi:hypothetical protein
MRRGYYLLGWSYVVVCVAVAYPGRSAPAVERVTVGFTPPAAQPVPSPSPRPADTGAEWFRRVKPYCNAVEVEVIRIPPPASVEGSGYHAACFALAGKIDHARRLIDGLASEHRRQAAEIVFNVGHSVADAGDDRSAGPIMELVVDYAPDHYMALYHAGMSEYMLGQRELATRNLEHFLELYKENDGWRTNGIDVLARLRDTTAARADARRPREP